MMKLSKKSGTESSRPDEDRDCFGISSF